MQSTTNRPARTRLPKGHLRTYVDVFDTVAEAREYLELYKARRLPVKGLVERWVYQWRADEGERCETFVSSTFRLTDEGVRVKIDEYVI